MLVWNIKGFILAIFGSLSYFLGLFLFFNQFLMTGGVILCFLGSLSLVKKLSVVRFIFRWKMWRGVAWLIFGLFLLFCNLPLLGFLCKVYGAKLVLVEMSPVLRKDFTEMVLGLFSQMVNFLRPVSHFIFQIPLLGVFASFLKRNLV